MTTIKNNHHNNSIFKVSVYRLIIQTNIMVFTVSFGRVTIANRGSTIFLQLKSKLTSCSAITQSL